MNHTVYDNLNSDVHEKNEFLRVPMYFLRKVTAQMITEPSSI